MSSLKDIMNVDDVTPHKSQAYERAKETTQRQSSRVAPPPSLSPQHKQLTVSKAADWLYVSVSGFENEVAHPKKVQAPLLQFLDFSDSKQPDFESSSEVMSENLTEVGTRMGLNTANLEALDGKEDDNCFEDLTTSLGAAEKGSFASPQDTSRTASMTSHGSINGRSGVRTGVTATTGTHEKGYFKRQRPCWRCKFFREKCDVGTPCLRCKKQSSKWAAIGCRRGQLSDVMPEIELCPSRSSDLAWLGRNNTGVETITHEKVNDLSQRATESRQKALTEAKEDFDFRFPQPTSDTVRFFQSLQLSYLTRRKSSADDPVYLSSLLPLHECIFLIVWEAKDQVQSTFKASLQMPETLVLLRSAADYQAKWETDQLIATSLICLRTCLEALRSIPKCLYNSSHSLCKANEDCKIYCIANVEATLKIYLKELSRVFFVAKYNLRSPRSWLSSFYSFCIQSLVKKGLIELIGYRDSHSIPESNLRVVAVKQYLQLALRLFVTTSANYDPFKEDYDHDARASLSEADAETTSDQDFKIAQNAVGRDTWSSTGISNSMEYLQDLFETSGNILPTRTTSAPTCDESYAEPKGAERLGPLPKKTTRPMHDEFYPQQGMGEELITPASYTGPKEKVELLADTSSSIHDESYSTSEENTSEWESPLHGGSEAAESRKERFLFRVFEESGDIMSCSPAMSSDSPNGSSCSQPNTMEQSQSASTAPSRQGAGPSRKRKQRGDDDEQSNRPNPRRKQGPGLGEKLKRRGQQGRRFACHFHLFDKEKYRKNNNTGSTKYEKCSGPGWLNIHILKQHLGHPSNSASSIHHKIRCPICVIVFDRPEDVLTHQRADLPQCFKRSALSEDKDDIDDTTWDRITASIKQTGFKRLTQSEQNEINHWVSLNLDDDIRSEDVERRTWELRKWNMIWRILFPGHQIPSSPFYNDDMIMSLTNIELLVQCYKETLESGIEFSDIEDIDDTTLSKLLESLRVAISAASDINQSKRDRGSVLTPTLEPNVVALSELPNEVAASMIAPLELPNVRVTQSSLVQDNLPASDRHSTPAQQQCVEVVHGTSTIASGMDTQPNYHNQSRQPASGNNTTNVPVIAWPHFSAEQWDIYQNDWEGSFDLDSILQETPDPSLMSHSRNPESPTPTDQAMSGIDYGEPLSK